MMLPVLLGAVCWMMTIAGPSAVAAATTEEATWIKTLHGAVLTAREWEGDPDGTKYAPYLGQLQIVDVAVQRGDLAAVYAAMNRFMDMLANREHGIASAWADWLFDYCLAVAPPSVHDVSRHIRKVAAPAFEAPPDGLAPRS
jgi:hypothetical protein